VDRIYIIGRGQELEEVVPRTAAIETLLSNTEDAYGFPPFSIMERAITLRARNLHKGKKRDISTLRSIERSILEDFLGNMPVTRLISPNFGWADTIPREVLGVRSIPTDTSAGGSAEKDSDEQVSAA
jgi:hypothetical protein